MDHILTREEIVSLMSVRGRENIIHAVSMLDDALIRQYLTMVLLVNDMQRELDTQIHHPY